jgi:carboxypeptidase C (cathepsin A)
MKILLVALFLLPFAALPSNAQQHAAPHQHHEGGQAEANGHPGGGVLSLLPPDSVTEHTVDVGQRKLDYTATAGTFTLYDLNGEPQAAIAYNAYVLKGGDAANRPVTFVFNGGPGAASAYLHLGLVGPEVVDFGPHKEGGAARLRDNPDTWLKFTDLVMIDPIGTGWSRAAKPDKTDSYWNVSADAETIAKVIALYVAKNDRLASPKYLLGESYGGFRSIKVARALQREQGIVVNGIVMLSPFLEGALQFNADRFALGAALKLPSLAASELDRNGKFTSQALQSAEHFALTDYLTTLAGPTPEGDKAKAFYQRVADMTGLPLDVVARTRGLIRDDYAKRAGPDGAGEIVSPYDGSSSAPDPFPEMTTDEGPDPVLDGYTQALGGLYVGYARDVLGFKTEMTYNLLNRETAQKWDWGHGGGIGQASATRDLRELLALDPGLRILIAHGRDDLVTPFSVSRYIIDHLPPIGTPGRLDLKLYKGGHMFYLTQGSRAAFTTDAAAFYGKGTE